MNAERKKYRIIETIGPSCSGKTTLVDYILEKLSDLKLPKNLVGRRRLKVSVSADANFGGFYTDFAERVIHKAQREINIQDRLKLLQKVVAKILLDMTMREKISLGDQSIFLLDEGVCKAYYGVIQKMPDESLAEMMKYRVLIFHSVRDPQIVVDRISNRVGRNLAVTAYRGKDPAGIMDTISRTIKENERFCARCGAIGVPIIKTWADDPIEESAVKIVASLVPLIQDDIMDPDV